MEIIKVGIKVNNSLFGDALAKGIAREGRKILISSDQEDFTSCDLILTDNTPEENREIYLSCKKEEDISQQNLPYSVYRYTDSRKMTDYLYYAYFRLTGKAVSGGNPGKCHLITGLSCTGGAWTTSVLLSAGTALSLNYGKKCLYLSLCPFNIPIGEEQVPKGYFLKLIYYLRDRDDFPLGIFIRKTENVDYLATEIFNPSWNEMNKECLLSLAGKLSHDGYYDYLLVDLGNHLLNESVCILECAESILFIEKYQENGNHGGFFPEGKVLHIVTDIPENYSEENNRTGVKKHKSLNLQGDYESEIGKIIKWIGEETGYGK